MPIFNREKKSQGGWEGSLKNIIKDMPPQDQERYQRRLKQAKGRDAKMKVINSARNALEAQGDRGGREVKRKGIL